MMKTGLCRPRPARGRRRIAAAVVVAFAIGYDLASALVRGAIVARSY